jgi:antibiotic biosynthesis monooxygenase (ABM) superfamily enzyme
MSDVSSAQQGDPAGVTVVVTRVVHPGHEEEFAAWADDVDRTAAGFDGHRGGVRLHDEQGLNHLVYQFDSADHLHAWEASPRRRELIARGNRISDEERSTSGTPNAWFIVPGHTSSPRWKTFVLTWIAVYPILLILATVIKAIAPGMPQPVALAISSGTLTALLTWVILPRLTRRARPWLFRGARPTRAERPDPTS